MKSDNINASQGGTVPGYNFGVKIDSFFGDNYALATGLTINTSGGKINYYETGNPLITTQTYNLKYVEIPMGLRLRSGDLHRINIYGRFGVSSQINFRATDEMGNNISDEIRFLDLSYHLGGGVEFSLGGRNALMLGLIFNNGFNDITKRSGFEDSTILNRLTLEFGFIF